LQAQASDSRGCSQQSNSSSGTVHVETQNPTVDQLWSVVQGQLKEANQMMKPFLKLFGVKEGNGLSPFLCDITSQNHLQNLLVDLFRPPPKDIKANNNNDNGNNGKEDYTGVVDHSLPQTALSHVKEIQNILMDLEEGSDNGVPPNFILDDEELDDEQEHSTQCGENDVVAMSKESFVDGVNSMTGMETFHQCMEMLQCDVMGQKLMNLLDPGKSDKGAILSEGKYKLLQEHWSKAKVHELSNDGVDTNTNNSAVSESPTPPALVHTSINNP
jgi:hypothetical protein